MKKLIFFTIAAVGLISLSACSVNMNSTDIQELVVTEEPTSSYTTEEELNESVEELDSIVNEIDSYFPDLDSGEFD